MIDQKKIHEIETNLNKLSNKVEFLEKEIAAIKHVIEQDRELYKKLLDKIDELAKTSTELKIAIERFVAKFDKDLELLNQRTNIDYIYQTVMHRLFNEGAIDKQIPGLFMKLLVASTTIVTIIVIILDKIIFRN